MKCLSSGARRLVPRTGQSCPALRPDARNRIVVRTECDAGRLSRGASPAGRLGVRDGIEARGAPLGSVETNEDSVVVVGERLVGYSYAVGCFVPGGARSGLVGCRWRLAWVADGRSACSGRGVRVGAWVAVGLYRSVGSLLEQRRPSVHAPSVFGPSATPPRPRVGFLCCVPTETEFGCPNDRTSASALPLPGARRRADLEATPAFRVAHVTCCRPGPRTVARALGCGTP